MRGSLSGVRARVDRLASRLRLSAQPGCSECRGEEQTTRIVCVYGDEPPDIPADSRCETCGRVIAHRYVTVRWDVNMRPPEQPLTWEPLDDEPENPKRLS